MTSQEMFKAKAKPGYCWVNVAALGEAPDWQEQVSPHGAMSDPNAGIRTLFGYDTQEFMARQYDVRQRK
jgi:hypothetical protein